MLDARQIQALIGGQKPPSLNWIRENVPGRIKLGHKMVRWPREWVFAWLKDRQRKS